MGSSFDGFLLLLDGTHDLPGSQLFDIDMVFESLLLHVGEVLAVGRQLKGGRVGPREIIGHAIFVITFVMGDQGL
jgi:hypothetical protein